MKRVNATKGPLLRRCRIGNLGLSLLAVGLLCTSDSAQSEPGPARRKFVEESAAAEPISISEEIEAIALGVGVAAILGLEPLRIELFGGEVILPYFRDGSLDEALAATRKLLLKNQSLDDDAIKVELLRITLWVSEDERRTRVIFQKGIVRDTVERILRSDPSESQEERASWALGEMEYVQRFHPPIEVRALTSSGDKLDYVFEVVFVTKNGSSTLRLYKRNGKHDWSVISG